MSASLAVQRMLFSALAGAGGVTAVYDGPPVDAVAPYLVIGGDLVIDWSTKTTVGHEHRVTISVWDAGPGAARAKAVMGEVEGEVAAMTGSRDGTVLVSTRLVRSQVLTDAEGWTRGLVEFRIRTVQV